MLAHLNLLSFNKAIEASLMRFPICGLKPVVNTVKPKTFLNGIALPPTMTSAVFVADVESRWHYSRLVEIF